MVIKNLEDIPAVIIILNIFFLSFTFVNLGTGDIIKFLYFFGHRMYNFTFLLISAFCKKKNCHLSLSFHLKIIWFHLAISICLFGFGIERT